MKADTNTPEYFSFPSKSALRAEYERYLEVRHQIVGELKEQTEAILVMLNSSPAVSGRVKFFSSYYTKYIRLLKSGIKTPRITDLMGVRIICPFIEDLNAAEALIKENFYVVETEKKGHNSFREFGYESTHILVKIPQRLINKYGDPGIDIAEFQIRTILQDAWAEVEHELVYKAHFDALGEPLKRKLAAINASLSLADIVFQEIRDHQREYSKELEKRRGNFYNKIEESIDSLLFSDEQQGNKNKTLTTDTAINESFLDDLSIDGLLVSALIAHNKNQSGEAIRLYSKILDLQPSYETRALIYKHRGMANFAFSQYNEAIEDFSNSLEYDKHSYKAAYYRGVVHSVLKQYSQAIDDYTLSLSINPYQSFCLFRRGQAFFHLGDYPQALSDCENSLALEPTNDSVKKFKELLHEKLKM